MSLIEIRPIIAERWHGKTGKDSFARPKKYRCLVDPNTGMYCVNLTDKEKEIIAPLAKDSGLDLVFTGNPHPFWDESTIPVLSLPDATVILDISKPIDLLRYKIARGSRFVANSTVEQEQGLFPDATHVIFNESEFVEVKASKIKAKNNAIKMLGELSLTKKISLLMVVAKENFKGKSEDAVDVRIDKVLQEDPILFLKHMNQDKEETYLMSIVLEALQKSVLIKKGLKISYMDSPIGVDEMGVVDFLKDTTNEELKQRIIEQLN